MVVRWPGHIKPGTVKNQMFAALDWLPTLVDIAGGPKGDELKKQIEAGKYPGIVKTTLDGFDQRDYLEGKSDKSARDVFFYYSGATPSAVRYKNWKMYYTMAQAGAAGWFMPLVTYHWTLVAEHQARSRSSRLSASDRQSRPWAWAARSAARAPPICTTGTCCRSASSCGMKELMSYKEFPPLQAPETYNLDRHPGARWKSTKGDD